MDRRSFLLGAAAFAMPIIPPGRQLAFKVLRNGSVIGDHHLAFSGTPANPIVDINVALRVKFAGITIYNYTLAATETWEDGGFSRLHSIVNNNGTMLEVEAHKVADGYLVTGTNHSNPAKSWPQYTAPPDTLPLTYWNKQMLQGNILNIQTAHDYRVTVNSPGWNALPTANGGTITAQRFDLTGKLRLSVWYDQHDTWAGLAFSINGDETYQRVL